LTLNNKHWLILQCCIQLIVRSDHSFLLFSLYSQNFTCSHLY